MNIEDLIREANPVRTSDLDAGDSPRAQRTLARILAVHPGARRTRGRRRPLGRAEVRGGPRSRRRRKQALTTAGLAAAAAGIAAGLVLAAPGASHRPGSGPGSAHPRTARPRTAEFTTARQVLLSAAAHVTGAPTTGRYWRVQEISGLTFPGGTKAHPYDISLDISYDQWNPRQAGQNYWLITQELGAVPATPADAAAWRAAGSPTTWNSGERRPGMTRGGWGRPLAATTAGLPPRATWGPSDGTVGFVEGDLAGLKAAQFRRMPTSRRGVEAVLRQYYVATGCNRHPGCSPEDQFTWTDALALLQDPVSAGVRSATFKVMASLPGVRLLGPMTDPLGRRGYALATSSLEPGGMPGTVTAVVIDPHSGSLLATEDIAPMPRNVQCHTIGLANAANRGKPVFKLYLGHGKYFTGACIGPVYEGRSYAGQVDVYTALVSAGWTDASPVLPRLTQKGLVFPGLDPSTPELAGLPGVSP
jgi:hypothetical protein